MSLGTVTKDPSDVRIWAIDWSAFLASRSATISSSSYTVQDGLTKVTDSSTTTQTQVKISGGTVDHSYVVANAVVLSNGETVEKSFVVTVREQ